MKRYTETLLRKIDCTENNMLPENCTNVWKNPKMYTTLWMIYRLEIRRDIFIMKNYHTLMNNVCWGPYE